MKFSISNARTTAKVALLMICITGLVAACGSNSTAITSSDLNQANQALDQTGGGANTPQPVPTPSSYCLVGPDNLYSLEVPPGWYGSGALDSSGKGSYILRNYSSDQVKPGVPLPPNALDIITQIGILKEGETFDQWIKDYSNSAKTQPSPLRIGAFDAYRYDLKNSTTSTVKIVLPFKSPRLIIFDLTPADSPTLRDGLSIISTFLGIGTCAN